MNNFRKNKTFRLFFQKQFLKNTLSSSRQMYFHCLASETTISTSEPFFLNFSFDKSRLKSVVSWFFEKYGQYKTILFLEKLKEFGFGYATTGGISLGIDDLKIPEKKIALISTAETKVAKDLMDYRNAKITGIERTQRLIYIWNQTNDMLKQEVLKYFETMDLFNPIYMMAFSGARGNMSQVRQLVGMRGLMSDPQGQIIDFPIQSNFREGLTLTEYLISTYGARKGIVDTALRTATAGYLTRRLVDVAQHVIVSQFDCGTFRGIFLFDMKEANKTIYSFQNRLIGRVLAQDILILKDSKNGHSSEKTLLAARNQEIDSKLAFAIAKVSKKALVRSPLTCETPRLICQLCYGWSLSQGKLVSVGEAVGVIAAQSIGEPGTQLTMRTFHTGGVFAGGLTDQILAPFDGRIQYVQNIPGSCIRTSLSEIAFLTKMPGSFFVVRKDQEKNVFDLYLKSMNNEKDLPNFQTKWKQKTQNVNVSEMYKIPAYAVLYLRNNEIVRKKQVLAQFSTVLKKSFQYGSAEQTLYSNLAGEFILNGLNFPFKNTRSQVLSKNSKSLGNAQKVTMQSQQQSTENEKFVDMSSNARTVNRRTIAQKNIKKIDLLVEKRSSEFSELSPIELKHDVLWKSKNWTNIWILSGKVLYHSFNSNLFVEKGDFLKKTSVLNRILWKKKKNWNISLFLSTKSTNTSNRNFAFWQKPKGKSQKAIAQKSFFVVLNKQNKSKPSLLSLSSNLFMPVKTLLNSSVYFSKKIQFLNTEAFFLEQNFRKTNFSKFCSSLLFSSTFSFPKILFQNNETRKKKIFQNKNMHWKNSLISPIQTKKSSFYPCKQVFYKMKFFPFSLFFLNILSSSKQNNIQTKKFHKSKNDILFYKTFQKIFFFSSLQNQKKSSEKLFVNSIVYKSSQSNHKKLFKIKLVLQKNKKQNLPHQKKHLKQVFFKFSTFHRTTPFFKFSSFSKTFNTSRKFRKLKYINYVFLSKKKFFPLKFSFLKNCSNQFWYVSNQLLKTSFQFHFFKTFDIQSYDFVSKFSIFNHNKKHYSVWQKQNVISNRKVNIVDTHSPNRQKMFSLNIPKKQKFLFQSGLGFSFFKSLVFNHFKISQNFEQSQNFRENIEKQIFFKKTLFSFDYKKIRYNKYGYVFSFQNSSKNKSFAPQFENSFQIFTKLKQSSFDFQNMTNPGKQETNISFGNGNFIGKDFPTFLSYYFPKNYQTVTNGIFTVFSFENNSKKQRYKQFFSLKQENKTGTLQKNFRKSRKNQKTVSFLQKQKIVETRMSATTKERNKFQSTIFFTKFQFLQNQTFQFVNKKLHFHFLNIFENSIQKNMLNYHLIRNSKQKQFEKTFSLFNNSLLNQKDFSVYSVKKPTLSEQKFFLKYLKKYNDLRFSRFELYTEEIFWIPQENYTFSILDFLKLQQKSLFSQSKNIHHELFTNAFETTKQVNKNLNFSHSLNISSKQILQHKKNEYISKMIFQKNPLFYLSNSQGQKKPFFSVLEGIWNYSISLTKLKYRQFAPVKHKKMFIRKKFHKIQQKFSFYKIQKEKSFLKNSSKVFFKNSSLRFFKFQTFKFFKTFCLENRFSNSFFSNNKKSFVLNGHKKFALDQKADSAVSQKNKFLFFSKKKNFLNSSLKFYFEKKLFKPMQKNFLFGLQKKIKTSNFETLKNLFCSKFENKIDSASLSSTGLGQGKIKHQDLSAAKVMVGKIFKNQCFTCVPFKKKNMVNSKKTNFVEKNIQESDVSFSTNFENQNVSNSFILQDQQLHLKIQSGWICVFPNSSNLFHWHQQITNLGHFFGKDFCFEQNKILQEAVLFEVSSSFSDVFQKIRNFHTIPFSNGTQTLKEKEEKKMNLFNIHNSKNTKISFCLKLLKKNKKSRYSNDGSIFVSQKLTSLFDQKTPVEKNVFSTTKKPTFSDKPFTELSIFNKEKNNLLQINKNGHFLSSKTNGQKQKKIALFLRPMQYRLLENPKNYQKIFLKKTLQNSSTKSDSISFVSSLKIYKKYHSILLNIQKPTKKFLQNIEYIESIIKTDFRKIYKKKKWQKNHSKQGVYFQSNKTKYNRNWSTRNQQKHQIAFQFDASKNSTKVPHFQVYSKKTMFLKFQNLLIRNTLKFINKSNQKMFPPFSPETNKSIFLNSHTHFQNFSTISQKATLAEQSANKLSNQPMKLVTTAKTNSFEKMYFSFYPIQFLPLSISNSSLNIANFERKNSQKFPTVFLNPLNNKIDFSLCHKKAAFLNQRFYSFDFLNKFIQTSSFWSNNDGQNVYFIYSIKKNLFKNFWNMSIFDSISSKNKKNSLKKKRVLLQSNIHRKSSIFRNFLFQKNQSFYANTQLLSPFDGELISMYTNELNWWKKASEISTIEKINTLFTVITKKDLFSFDFSNPFKNKKMRKNFVYTSETVPLADDSKKSTLSEKTLFSSNFIVEKQKLSFNKNHSNKFVGIFMKYSLKTKQKHLTNLYKAVIQNTPSFESLNSLYKTSEFVPKNFSVKKILKTKKFVLPENENKTKVQISSFVTKYEKKIYKFKNLLIGYPLLLKQPRLGKFLVAGNSILDFAIRKPGQIVHLSSFRVTLRRGQPFLVSPKGILHLANTPYIEKNVPILTLPYQTLQSGDIVQGIPKVEQYFEARTTIQGRLFISSLPILLKGIFQRYKSMLPLEQAVRQSFLKIQQLIVDGVQRVYRLQGVSIVDKHLEVIVRQMTTKVQIIHGAQTGFFPGEIVNLHLVERINQFFMVKVRYEPIVLGITRASLEVDSFLSASSFQQTTKILALASISRKKDFLKGLKENILVGNLIPSGTGYLVLGKHL